MTETSVQVVCRKHFHGIGCTVQYPDGRIVMVDGQWDSIETAERVVGEHHTRLSDEPEIRIDDELAAVFRLYRDRRVRQHQSLRDVAAIVRVAPATLSSWERSRAEPTPEQLALWRTAIGATT